MASVEKWTTHPTTGKPRWRARWRTPEGKERSKVCDTKREANRHIAKVESSKHEGSYVDAAEGRITLRSYSEEWLAAQTFDASTRQAVESRLRNHVYPTLGDRAIASIRSSSVQGWLSGLRCAPSTATEVLRYLSAVMSAAVDDGRIVRNPCAAKSVKPPKVVREKAQPFDVEIVQAIIAAHEQRWAATPVVAVGCGLRQGECFGLRKCDVDFLGRWLHVNQQVKRVGKRVFTDLPKGHKTRKIPLPDWVGVALAEHLRAFPVGDDDVLFPGADGDLLRSGWYDRHVWKPALRAAGVDVTDRRNGMHRLRHTFASVLLDQGESIPAVSEWLGHADPAITLRIYAHLMPASEDRTRRAIDSVFSDSDSRVTDVSQDPTAVRRIAGLPETLQPARAVGDPG